MRTINHVSRGLALATLFSAALVACGGGDSAAVSTAVVSDLVVPITASTVAAVAGTSTPMVFPSGVTAFGTAQPVTLTLSGSSATPAFSIETASAKASGVTTFGSCIFTVTSSTFPASSPLATGGRVEVTPCNLTVGTAGAAASASSTRSVSLTLGAQTSSSATAVVTITPNGTVVVNGTTVGTGTVITVTGVTGSSS